MNKQLDPMLAGFLRGLALAAASAVVLFSINFLDTGTGLPTWLEAMTPILLVVLRTAEGYIDRRKAQQ